MTFVHKYCACEGNFSLYPNFKVVIYNLYDSFFSKF